MPTEIRVTWLLLISYYLKPQQTWSDLCRLWALRLLWCSLWDLLHDHADSDRHRPILCHHATSDLYRCVVKETGLRHPHDCLDLLTGLEPAPLLWLEWGHTHTFARAHKNTHPHTDAEMHTHDPVKAAVQCLTALNLTVEERALFPHRTLNNVSKKDVQKDADWLLCWS